MLTHPVAASGAAYPVRYGYDTMGRMKELGTTRDGSTFDETRWGFNQGTGLATNKVYADDSAIVYSYTDDGKPLRTTWARGVWKENAYNADGLLSGVSYSDATPDVMLGYDAFQHLVSASNAVVAYIFANDALGAATNETATVCGEVYTLMRRLDEHHRLAGIAIFPLPLGQGQGEGTAPYSVAYAYDADNRLATVSNDVFAVDYAYTSDGWDAGHAITLTNGTTLSRNVVRDAYRRHLVAAISNSVDDVAVNPLAYNYDLINRLTSRNADTFGYNARSEVISAAISNTVSSYAYDYIGNHTTSSVDSVATTYAANSLNQYSQISVPSVPSVEALSYDLDGNMVSNGVWTYSYDAENRLSAAYSNTVCAVSNAYDYMSRRVVKWTPSHTTTFVYDGWLPVLEIVVTAGGASTNYYHWGKDLSGTPQDAGGVGGLLAISVAGVDDPGLYFPFYDANGNITAYVDECGTVVAEYAYDAFGATISQNGPMADAFALRFSTKYHDVETGLYHYGYRFYSPVLHRWLNRDPIEEDGGENLYAFCGNNSIFKFDYLGLSDIMNYVRFVYLAKDGQTQTIDSRTDADDIQIEYDYTSGAGRSGYSYHKKSGRYLDNSKRRSNGQGPRDICQIDIKLRIRLTPEYRNLGDSYIAPRFVTTVSYKKHVDKAGTQRASGYNVSGNQPDFEAYIMKEHEKGHARGYLELLDRHELRLRAKIFGSLNWGSIRAHIKSGNEDQLEKEVNAAITKTVISDDVSRVHMQAADESTCKIFHENSGWSESESNLPRGAVKWVFTPGRR